MAEQPKAAQDAAQASTQTTVPVTPAKQEPAPESAEPEPSGPLAKLRQYLGKFYGLALGLGALILIFICVLLFALAIALVGGGSGRAAHWVSIIRDLFIIVLAMEGMFMGLALIVLVLQLAALVNLLQNEIKPIVDNANETVTTVRGTAQFMSQSVVEPVVKFGAMVAGVGALVRDALGIRRTLNAAGRDGKNTESK